MLLASKIIKLAVFYVTAPSHQVALKLSDILLEKKLIACCNIVENIDSVYLWEGKISKDKQVLMIMKSREQLTDQITFTVEIPEIIAIPIVGGSSKYMNWVIENTKTPQKSQKKEKQGRDQIDNQKETL